MVINIFSDSFNLSMGMGKANWRHNRLQITAKVKLPIVISTIAV
tara:strand:- start:8652 stop:8783 length:132 start_codon:yes stop_codon:yes gene_type:complete